MSWVQVSFLKYPISLPLLLTINHIQSLYWSLLINISHYYITAICHPPSVSFGFGGALAGANSSAAAARPLCRISLEHRVPWKNFNIFQQPVPYPSDPFRSLQPPAISMSDCVRLRVRFQLNSECWVLTRVLQRSHLAQADPESLGKMSGWHWRQPVSNSLVWRDTSFVHTARESKHRVVQVQCAEVVTWFNPFSTSMLSHP